MEIKKSAFVSSAASPGNRIKSHLKQIAVVGKSNVGKSSFINLLTNDGKLARTGKLPGRTRLINYFLINEEFFLTDLPGYGFARVSREEKQKWALLIDDYLLNEEMLCHVLFLVDIRHEPTADDAEMYNFLVRRNLPFTVVATKSDKLPKSQPHTAPCCGIQAGRSRYSSRFGTFKNGKRSGTRQNRTYNLHRNAVDATRRFSMHFLTPLHIH